MAKVAEVVEVAKMTRVLFKDLKQMTDVSSIEKLTDVSNAEVRGVGFRLGMS